MNRVRTFPIVLVSLIVLMQAGPARADKLYATRGGTASGIDRMNLDGSAVTNIVSTASEEIRGIAMDLAHSKMFYTQAVTGGSSNKVRKANFDGSGAQDVILVGANTTPKIGRAHV